MMIDFDYLWPKWGVKPDGVLHLGANTGQERDVYLRHGVKKVIWVEAIPSTFEQLQEFVKHVPGTVCILACVSDKDGEEVTFNVSNNEQQSSSMLPLAHHKIIHPEVSYVSSFITKTNRVDSLLRNFKLEGKWFLNADLQGAELMAFRGCGDLLNRFDWIYTELNKKEVYAGCAIVEEVDAFLLDFGFKRAETGQWVGDSWTDGLYVKHK